MSPTSSIMINVITTTFLMLLTVSLALLRLNSIASAKDLT